MGYHFFIPRNEVDVAIKITSGHHVAARSFSFTRKDDHIEQIPQVRVVNALKEPDVTRMSAWIPRDKDLALDDFCQRVDGAEDLGSLHSVFSILHAMAVLVHREAVLSDLDEDLTLFESACWVDNTDQHARLGEKNPSLLFQIQFLVELHAMEDAREDRLLSDVNSFENRFLQRGLEAFAGVHR